MPAYRSSQPESSAIQAAAFPAARKLGIKYMSSHKIRFWAITALCRETGGDITAVGAYAGQACRQTTLHYIRRAQDEAVQKAAARKVFG